MCSVGMHNSYAALILVDSTINKQKTWRMKQGLKGRRATNLRSGVAAEDDDFGDRQDIIVEFLLSHGVDPVLN